MQSRHRHFIRRVTQARYPTCIVAIEAAANSLTSDCPTDLGAKDQLSWSASIATLDQGIVTRTWERIGVGNAEWWGLLSWLLRKNPHILLVSWNTWLNSIALGFWQNLENRRIYLSGIDPRVVGSPLSGRNHYGAGYWVLENPPTILNFRIPHITGSVQWIDLRNFGYSDWTEITEKPCLPKYILQTIICLLDFLRSGGLGSLKPTVASQALYSWKYRYLRHSIHVSTNDEQNTLACEALYGGRNECYKLGDVGTRVRQYDFNSLYPSIYAREALPVRCRGITESPSDGHIRRCLNGRNCIARINVETDVPCIPKRHKGRLIFPIGRFQTVVCWPELELAYEHANYVKVHTLATYDCERCLADYGIDLYAQRLHYKGQNNRVLSSYIKALLVSLPGKFGQRNKRWQFAADQRAPGPWRVWHGKNSRGKIGRKRSIAWYVEEEIDSGLGYEAVPEIAAWVNSWGRRILFEEMCHVGREKIVYCDTDSLWIKSGSEMEILGESVSNSGKMGELRYVDTYNRVTFHGLKHYTADGISTPRYKGTDAQSTVPWSGNIDTPVGVMWHCCNKRTPTSIQTARLGTGCGVYQNGIVHPNGNVTPFILDEW